MKSNILGVVVVVLLILIIRWYMGDGTKISGLNDAKKALKYGADGIGLFRTEFCFLNRQNFPSEDEQLKLYTKIINVLPKKEFIIRLSDFGSDKKVDYIDQPYEQNPAMGYRGLRLGFKYYDKLLKPQLRALIRLSLNYNIKILCPMISDIAVSYTHLTLPTKA